ncbi:MAG: MurR/RpiR family transcriptional regulator [Burkholderiales bacterium]|nr:MurR/RpiR family transcriptional regulator [Burkholderiales bacterium]
MSTDAAPWPRLLACWQGGRLRTLLLHADGRRAHVRDEPTVDGAQLAPALADALAGLHRPVRHAVLMCDTELAADALRQRLGLATLCTVPQARALRLAPEDASGWAGAARALDLALHTPASGAVCAQIRAAYDRLTRCERRVADVVLANPGAALDTATARLAEAADVSQPQVIRFCRALGFDGVKTFKRALAESLAPPSAHSEAPAGHPLLARSLQALGHVDRARLTQAALLLAQARQIDVLADAARAPLRDLALHTLWRLGLPARPVQGSDRPGAPVCLALGDSPGTAATTVLITQAHQPGAHALQLVTGPEPATAPTLLATLMLQLLLAELPQDVAASPAPRRPAAAETQASL